MIRRHCAWIVAAALAAAPLTASAQEVPEQRSLYLAFGENGRVTLSARNVTTRDILAEWARQCGCFVVNADRLDSVPSNVPLQFTNATQAEVLRSLLRQTAGYVLTPKRPDSTSPSDYETIYVVAARAPMPTQTFSPLAPGVSAAPVAAPIVSVGSPDDEIPPVVPIAAEPDSSAPPPTGAEPAPQPQPVAPAPVGGFVVAPVQSVTPPPSGPAPGTAPAPAARPGGVTPVPNSQP